MQVEVAGSEVDRGVGATDLVTAPNPMDDVDNIGDTSDSVAEASEASRKRDERPGELRSEEEKSS